MEARRNLLAVAAIDGLRIVTPAQALRAQCLFLEQTGIGARAHEVDGVAFQLVDQQEVAADVAFTVIGPIPFDRVVQPLGSKGRVVGDQQQHCLLEPVQVVAARAGKPFPFFLESRA